MGLLSILGVVEKVIDNVVPDPQKKMELQLELARLADEEAARESAENLGQMEVNKTEAGHRSVFVAGWRPAIGWVGALSLFMYYPVQIAVQLSNTGKVDLDVTDLLAIIAGLLGFGIQRSFDKLKGTSNDVLPMRKVTPVALPLPEPKKKVLGVEWPF